MSRGIKMLPLDSWMKFDPTLDGTKEALDPYEIKDGWYYNRFSGFCWYQVKHRAYVYDAEMFLYTLSLLNHRPLTPKERKAFDVLKLEKKLTRKQREMLQLDREWHELRKTSCRAKLAVREILEEK